MQMQMIIQRHIDVLKKKIKIYFNKNELQILGYFSPLYVCFNAIRYQLLSLRWNS